jgi:hypothetical protein
MAGRQDGIPIAEAATLLDLSQEAVRKRIQRGTLAGYKRDGGWFVLLDVDTPTGAVTGRQDDRTAGRQDASGRQDSPLIEAEYRVTPEELQVAIERTGAKYINDFTGLYEMINAELARQYEARLAERDLALAAKDETIAAKDQTIATQAEALAEARRRAETIQAEYDRRREAEERQRQIAAQAASAAPHATETSEEASPGMWARLGRWWRG